MLLQSTVSFVFKKKDNKSVIETFYIKLRVFLSLEVTNYRL